MVMTGGWSAGAQRVGGGEAGRAQCGVEAGDRADRCRGRESDADRGRRYQQLPAVLDGQGVGGRGADEYTDEASGGAEQQRLDEELGCHVSAGGAEGSAEADLGSAFEYRDDLAVHLGCQLERVEDADKGVPVAAEQDAGLPDTSAMPDFWAALCAQLLRIGSMIPL
jgi:hypothetical protein